METVRIGMVGAGGIARAHLEMYERIEGADVVAIADVDLDTAARTATRWDIPHIHEDYLELVERDDIDAVYVCTPTAVHGGPTIAALDAGKHVFVEKPMEASLPAAVEMVRAAREAKGFLMVGMKLRFSPSVEAAKDVMTSGALGSVYYTETVADRARATPGGSFIRRDLAGYGATADLGVYALDTALYLLDHPIPVAVSGITSNYISRFAGPVAGAWSVYPHEMEVEDFAAAWVRFAGGSSMVLKTSWSLNLDTLGGTFFLGEKGGLRIGVGEVRGTEPGVTLFRDEFGTMTRVELQELKMRDERELLLLEDREFVRAVREGGPTPVDPEGVLLTNVIIQGIMDSSGQGGREVELKIPEL